MTNPLDKIASDRAEEFWKGIIKPGLVVGGEFPPLTPIIRAALDDALKLVNCASTGLPDREALGQLVRVAWVEWAREQDHPKKHWLSSWAELPEPMREVDRRIGEAVALAATAEVRRQLAQAKAENARLEPKAKQWDQLEADIAAASFPSNDETVDSVIAESNRQDAELARLQAIVDKLDKFADGAPAMLGDSAWYPLNFYGEPGVPTEGVVAESEEGGKCAVQLSFAGRNPAFKTLGERPVEKCYSSLAAAQATHRPQPPEGEEKDDGNQNDSGT